MTDRRTCVYQAMAHIGEARRAGRTEGIVYEDDDMRIEMLHGQATVYVKREELMP